VRLTKKQREEVVMLLRCAADALLVPRDWSWPFCSATTPARESLGTSDEAYMAAYDACTSVGWEGVNRDPVLSAYLALEAALLIEEGVLP
jgi:hypothetical protein